MIYDELTGEVIENPDLTKGKVYTEEKVIGHKEAQRILLEGSITDFDPEGCWMEVSAEDITETVEKYHKYTIDELIEQQQAARKPADTSISQDKKLELLLNAIPTAAYPTESPKVGYKWSPMYDNEAGFGWEMVIDPDAFGTQERPYYWKEGMEVKAGYYYTDESERLMLAVEDGVPDYFGQYTFMEEITSQEV